MIDVDIWLSWLCIGLAGITLFLSAGIGAVWRHRKYVIDAVLAFLAVGLVFAIEQALTGKPTMAVLYGISAAFLAFLAFRTRFGRLNEQFLQKSTRISSVWFLVLFASFILFWHLGLGYINTGVFAIIVMIAALLAASLFFVQSSWSLSHFRLDKLAEAGKTLPSVTLAIPARNETHALTACLEAALQSDYQKLEIIVLDDCSQDATSQLVKSFAHAGVRFIPGDIPAEGWLGKNQACQTLLKEATGAYVVFIGVDTILQKDSISKMVALAEDRQLSMLSVLPMRGDMQLSFALQPLRYVWQVILPFTLDRVPVSSESWLVKRTDLLEKGGFNGVKNQIIPEKTFAKMFNRTKHYRFISADATLPLYYDKKWSSLAESAMRIWYPSLRQSPLRAVGVALLLLLAGVGPFLALFADVMFVQFMAAMVCFLYLLTYALVLSRLSPRTWWLHMWLLPLAILQEIALLLVSMLRYEFSDVTWKGRNVCYPVLEQKR